MSEQLKLRDIVLAMSASTDSAVNKVRFNGMDYAATASFSLLSAAWNSAIDHKIRAFAGPVVSSDMFYTEDPEQWKLWARFGVLAVEMETAELYTLAAKYRCDALSVLTVSDHMATGEATSAEDRERSFSDMIDIALDSIFS